MLLEVLRVMPPVQQVGQEDKGIFVILKPLTADGGQ